jgi:hypothetical protein
MESIHGSLGADDPEILWRALEHDITTKDGLEHFELVK